jgi:hypothetical protein
VSSSTMLVPSPPSSQEDDGRTGAASGVLFIGDNLEVAFERLMKVSSIVNVNRYRLWKKCA